MSILRLIIYVACFCRANAAAADADGKNCIFTAVATLFVLLMSNTRRF
jgi:hypothetical protein